jgi:hypothetical protein
MVMWRINIHRFGIESIDCDLDRSLSQGDQIQRIVLDDWKRVLDVTVKSVNPGNHTIEAVEVFPGPPVIEGFTLKERIAQTITVEHRVKGLPFVFPIEDGTIGRRILNNTELAIAIERRRIECEELQKMAQEAWRAACKFLEGAP